MAAPKCLVGLIERVHRAALIVGQGGQILLAAIRLHCVQARRRNRPVPSARPAPRCCRPRECWCRRDDIGGGVQPGEQLLVEGIAVVGGDTVGKPLAGAVVFCLEFGPAQSEERGQHHDDAQRQCRAAIAQDRGEPVLQHGQLLLGRGQVQGILSARFASR